jgi:hypothetical protein
MTGSFEDRLNQILPRLCSPELLKNQGLGNEIGFWIFDYPPERELEMRSFLTAVILPGLARHQPPIRAGLINLFDLVIELLEERGLLDKAIEMQKAKGDEAVLASLRSVLKEEKIAQKLVSRPDVAGADLVILTGVGSVYPMLRAHTLLSALHPLMKDTPLLILYPGRYDGTSLRLFNKLAEDNYYRAFQLVS